MPAKLDNRHGIELAEGIAIHLHPAGLVPRLAAKFIDTAILTLFFWVISMVVGFTVIFTDAEISFGLTTLCFFAVYWFYDPFFELMKTPATPGKRVMKLRVVKLSGTPTSFGSSFLRALLWPIDSFPPLTGICTILFTKHSQRLGDLVAGTLVVHNIEPLPTGSTVITAPPLRPSGLLQREDQIAFSEFGRRHKTLTSERQQEITKPLEPIRQSAPDGTSYALGIAHWLKNNEE